jgi:ribonuclease Z
VRFRLKGGFAGEEIGRGAGVDGVLHREAGYRVSTAILEHRTPCLAFAIEEAAHVNVWKNRLAELGLPVGAWLHALKRAVVEARPDDHPIRIAAPSFESRELPLAALRHVVTVTPGQKIGYVTDAADTAGNRAAIIALVRNADLLFIEAVFAQADAALAAERAHLTTKAAGEIARAAGVRALEPFHFSPRYAGEEARMLDEVRAAFGD